MRAPITIDDATLIALGRAGHRWMEGHVAGVGYRWLLPPDWVLAGALPDRQSNGLVPLCGAGERDGRMTAVLAVVSGRSDSPVSMVGRAASDGAEVIGFHSGSGQVAERLQEAGDRTIVTTVHAFTAASEPLRFLIAAIGPSDPEVVTSLRTLGVALSISERADGWTDRRRRGRLVA